ncbi:MAG: fold, partial [Phycisphaerales bacterium]|nr:fold [Phycisphaerales bacterium]
MTVSTDLQPVTGDPRPTSPAASRPVDLPDLSACEREAIRVPGSVQPHGVLLAVDPTSLVVR